MHRRSTFLLAGLLLVTATTACRDAGSDAKSLKPISLLNRWSEVQIDEQTPAPTAPARSEVRFDGDGAEATWSALDGIEDLRVEDGLLVGRSTSETPIIAVDFVEPQGGDDDLWSVELRLRTTAGTRVSVHPPLDPGPPIEVVKARIGAWPVSSPITSAAELTTFSVVLDRVFTFEMPLAERNIKRVLIRPTDAAGADFAIESLRFIFRKEMLASIDSGPGWHGLGEVFRESLVSRAPEALRFSVELPDRPWLELAVGTIDQQSPDFTVEVVAEGENETVAELRAEAPEKWQATRIDLARWEGQNVELRLKASGEEGQLAFWGGPTVRSAAPDSADEPAHRPQAVVVFLADTLRADHLDAWGYGRETAPRLAQLANEGVRFERTVAQSTWTKVSVSSILTSLYPSTTGVAGLHDRISAGETTLAEAFREAGYATFATSSVPFSGQLTNLHQGVELMYETGALTVEGGAAYRSKTARPWVDAYLDWLELHRDVPTFALVHAMDPHSPFKPEQPFDTMWSTAEDAERFAAQADQVRPHIESPLLQRFMAPSREELERAEVDEETFVAHEKAWYDGSIRGLDAQLERMMARMDELGLGEKSLLAFVSDHGEEFLEHGKHWHGETVYGEVTNVPMALWGHGVPQGVVVDEVVKTIDLMPTLLDLAGLGIPERVQGRSLRPLFEGGELRAVPAFVELPSSGREDPSSYAILDAGWKLVSTLGASPSELYSIEDDPLDQVNLAADHPEEVARLEAELERFRSWAEAQKLDDADLASEMSAEQLEQLRSLGYVE